MMRDAYKLVTVLLSFFPRINARGSIIKRQVSDLMIPLQFLQHVVSANLPTLVNGMKQFGFEPEDTHDGSEITTFGFRVSSLEMENHLRGAFRSMVDEYILSDE